MVDILLNGVQKSNVLNSVRLVRHAFRIRNVAIF